MLAERIRLRSVSTWTTVRRGRISVLIDLLVARTGHLLTLIWRVHLIIFSLMRQDSFSLAAAIACSYCAKNLILLGDQMQLEQVNVGVHPSDSGLSVLNYYMNGKSTVERTHGVFLDQTRRMHPQVCGLISELVYDKRLSSHESTFGNQLELPRTCVSYWEMVREFGLLKFITKVIRLVPKRKLSGLWS